ncbi:spectrin beta chain-like isoform X1 [Montipora foliosa]|uniref:spectrin beta chain-like isoform X1 n=1 Tax=Montipora foliosa TaxID=591990 RepID=UPI0035F12E5D
MSYIPPPTPTFEKDRIKALKNERINSQKKTFTKWVNSFLDKHNQHVDDLFTDLCDGRLLISLLEIISGENLGKIARGKLRVHKIENVNKALQFLQRSVKLESIGAEDIVDGNERLILAVIWMIILRFQIADISYQDDLSQEKKSAKEALLLWCQRMTRGYPGVDIQNFTTSWRNGLAFNALLHKHRPDVINYGMLRPNQHEANLNNAFNVAEESLGITKLLDAEDVDCPRPDEKSIMTYVSMYYQYFAKMKSEETGGRRIAKILGILMEVDQMEKDYEMMVTDLLNWLNSKILELGRPFQKSMIAVQREMAAFKHFRTVEKPPKYSERVNIEAHLFSLQTKRKGNNQQPYVPPEGRLVLDVNRAWQMMESAEHDREMALREELIRQEMLEKLAEKFERKASLRESWLDDMMHVLEGEALGQDAATVEAAFKRHEAISTDVKAREERFQMVFDLAQELFDEDYHRSDVISEREEVIMTKWDKLIGKLEARRSTLVGFRDLVGLFREMDGAHGDMQDIEAVVRSEDYGKHLLDVENLLHKHSLVESQIQSQGESVQRINNIAQRFIKAKHPESRVIKERQARLNQAFEALVQLAKERRARLEDSLKLYKFFGDMEEEEMFVRETENVLSSKDVGKDLISLTRLQQKHKAMEAELSGRFAHCETVCAKGQSLIDRGHYASKEIRAKIKQLQNNWMKLKELLITRSDRLKDAAQSLQYYSDSNDVESWMMEKMYVVSSEDYGRDEQSAMSLLQRHTNVIDEIKGFADDVNRLREQSKLMESIETASQTKFEVYEEEAEVETDEEVEETVEKEVVKDVVQEIKVPQVKALHPFSGQGLKMAKGEVFFLIAKTNKDWWSVRRLTSKEAGYVPANYVKEIEPRTVKKITKQKVVVPEKVVVKRKVKKKVKVQKQRAVKPKTPEKKEKARRPVRRHFTAHFDRDNVATRQVSLQNLYSRLVEMAEIRRENLENSIKYFHFCHECDDIESWIKNKDKQLTSDAHESVRDIHAVRKILEGLTMELTANSGRITEINNLADQLVNTDHRHAAAVKTRRKEINDMWENLQRLKQAKEEELKEKHGVELFFDSCGEMNAWMQEKDAVLSDEDLGRDLETVRALQRRHQGFERDLAAVDEKLLKLQEQAQLLVSQHPRQAKQIKEKEAEILHLWNGLKGKASKRKHVLDEAYGQQGFLADSRDLLSWASDVRESLRIAEKPTDVNSAKQLIQEHEEKWEDIQTHNDRFDQLIEYGEKMIASSPRMKQVKDRLTALKKEKAALEETWCERNDILLEGQDLQAFIRDTQHIDSLSASHEAFLSNDDLGTSVDDVVMLLKQQENFEKTLTAQEEKINALSDMADSLLEAGHPDRQWISNRKDEVIKRRQNVKELAVERRQALLQSQLLQDFKRDTEEFEAWIQEKLQIATDESFRDLTNIERKLKRHQAFEAEIAANKDGFDGINACGKNLIQKGHYGAGEIEKLLRRLNEGWNDLVAKSADKSCRLQQAQQQHQFNRAMEDIKVWMNEVETLMSVEDLGHDLSSVKFLLKKHQGVESDIELHDLEIQSLCDQAQDLIDGGHFDAERIEQGTENLLHRFDELKELFANRKTQLEDSLNLHQFFYDLEMEMAWIREHMTLANSEDLGTSLIGVQRLQKRHLAFENELTNHQLRIDTVLASGQDLIDSNHYATDEIEERCVELSGSWDLLKGAAAERKEKLGDALESQKYFTEANEADSWMNDKAGLAANQDYGKDESSADKLLTRHTALQTAVDTYSPIIQGLAEQARKLVQGDHFAAAKISTRQRDIEEQFAGLKTLTIVRLHRLEESKKLYQYQREVNETAEWINEQLHVASAEDYGKDFEHLETIQGKFEDFKRSALAKAEQFSEVDNFAKRLVAEGHTDTVVIKEQQDILRSMWAQLQDQIRIRTKRLASAAEIHRFNRDLNELISRIQEKDASLSMEDLGRDIASVQGLQRKHEGHERDLMVVKQQVETLSVESGKLQTAYQGHTAESIKKHEEFVLSLWEELNRKTSRKKCKLKDSSDFHKLNNEIRDLVSWCIDMSRTISSGEPVHDVTDAETLLRRIDEYRSEMDAREEGFNKVMEAGEKMIDNGHFASDEIAEKLELLLTEREGLYATWEDHKTELDQAYDLHVFLRDAKQIDTLTSSQEVVLAGADLGNSADEVNSLLKKHENTEKLTASQDEKVTSLCEFGETLVANGHNEAEMITARVKAVCDRRNKLKEELEKRRHKLEESKKIAQFYQDVVEAESWITEKLQTASDESYKDPANLESKLQKHQAFEAELTAHEEAIDAVRETGEELIASEHFAAEEVDCRIEALYLHWEELLEASANKGKRLEEARDHQKFNQEVDIADSCISEKEAVVSSEDTGRDFDHCMRLQKKMKAFDQDVAVEAARVKAINRLAEKLVSDGHAGSADIINRQQALSDRWDRLQNRASERRQRLAEASEMHAFDRDCKDLSDLINEKAVIFSSEDFGRDLPGVEALLRKHDDLERDLTVIEGKMEVLEKEANRLARSQVHMVAKIQAKQTEIIENWERLNDLFDERKNKLDANRLLQIFLMDYRDLMTWMTDLATRISSGEPAKNVREAEALLELHLERKGVIEARMESFKSAHAFGISLVEQDHFAAEEIRENCEELTLVKDELMESWDEKQIELSQSYELQLFLRDAEQSDSWIATKEAFLQAEEFSDSLDTVETLLKNQLNFEKSIAAYEEKIKALQQCSDQLIQQEHVDSDLIAQRYEEVLGNWERLKKMATVKAGDLGESRKVFQFLRDAEEVESWMKDKLQTASEASYRETSNLLQKQQKHQTFEAELTANKGQLDNVLQAGHALLTSTPQSRETVQARLKDVDELWKFLADMSNNKGQRLKEAIQRQTFETNVGDLESWITEVENHLTSKDFGKDVKSANNFIKKHQLLETEITSHEERVKKMLVQAAEFVEADHFEKNEIEDRAKAVAERFMGLSKPAEERREKLQESLVLYRFLANVDEELAWIRDKEPLVKSDDLGRNLIGVQNLIKKQEAVDAEITAHEQLINAVMSNADQLIERQHYASEVIEARCAELQETWDELTSLSATRHQYLQESLQGQQFYTEVTEVETWIREKLPRVSSEDYGRDETSAQSLLRKHETFDLEMDSYRTKIKDLRKTCQELVSAKHFDAERIQRRQSEMETRFEGLCQKASHRHKRLLDSNQLFNFHREADEVESWITERESIAISDDYGRDLEHVETLLKKFEDFMRDLVTSGERIAGLTAQAQTLLDEGNSEEEAIENRMEEVCSMWDTLKERTNSRLEALDRAREIHAFNRNVEETRAWIQEKEAALMFIDDGARDLSSVQALQRKHQGFQLDLKALGEKVESIAHEAEDLASRFPEGQEQLTEQRDEVVSTWRRLQEKASSKKSNLTQSEELQKYLNDFRDLMSWISHMSSVITEDELPDDVTSAESLLTRHQEHKAEIETRQRSVNDFYDAADKLVADSHSASADVIDKKQRLSKAWQALQITWGEKGQDLEHSKEAQIFKRDADQLEAWLNARELDQESSDVGDSLDAVEELLKKHDEFEKMLLAQEMKLLGIKKRTWQEEGLTKERKDAMEEEELRREEEQARQEMEWIRKKEEDELQAKREEELMEKRRLEQIRLKEEREKEEKRRKELEEKQTLRALEERRKTEERAKREEEEEEKKRQEAVRGVEREEQNNNAKGLRKVSEKRDPVSIEGILQRKQELDSGGRKAHARVWKTLYTVLRGHELFFYREKKDSRGTNYSAPTVDLTDGFCEEASDAARRKNAFRLLCEDDSEFFFVAKDPQDLNRWISNINEAAGQIDLPAPPPPPPPQVTQLLSPTPSSRPERQESDASTEVTKRYGRTPRPLITVTSFDDEIDVLIDPPPPPPVNTPPSSADPEFPQGSMPMETETSDGYDITADIGSLPLEPDSLPPAFPPPDFADFNDLSDGEEIPVLPASPPPDFDSDDEGSLENGVEDSPLSNILSELQRPNPPPRDQKKSATPLIASGPESRLTQSSRDLSKPPIKPKPVNLASPRVKFTGQPVDVPGSVRSADGTSESAHDDKKQEKRKGVLGNIFKKKR